MKMIVWTFNLIALLALAAGAGYVYITYIQTPCQKTLYYDVGELDPQFNLSKTDLISDIAAAEKVWEVPFKHNFFEYRPGAAFKVNLIYDSRQAESNQRKVLDQDISTGKQSLSQLESRYNTLVDNYKSELSSYNNEVAKWNNSGGAPADVYRQLEQQRQDLNNQLQQIKNLETQLNSLSGSINHQIDSYNQTAGQVYHKGEYDGQEVNIYEFQGADELKLALAHELGHALGLGHATTKDSIMYPVLDSQDIKSIHLSKEDTDMLNTKCRLK